MIAICDRVDGFAAGEGQRAAAYNTRVPALAFFAGKGGVGKTTVSAAYAVHTALRRKRERVLVMSTDPAHSLADVLRVRLGDRPQRVAMEKAGGAPQLFAWQINAQKQFDKFLRAERDSILDMAAGATIFTREELEPLLDTTLPGMAEMAALLGIHELLGDGRYDHIVVDTAPLGHTLRLFELPQHFANFLRFLETAAGRDEALAEAFARRRLAPSPLIQHWSEMVAAVEDALSAEQATLTLVTTAESFALNETQRAIAWLRDSAPRLKVTGVVLNRIVRQAGKCARCARRARAAADARKFLARHFHGVPVAVGEDPGGPIMGVGALAAFGAHVFEERKLRVAPEPPRSVAIKMTSEEWPQLGTPLSFTVGKGGVGKTTISAALGFHQRAAEPRVPVAICSTDPAPSLDDVFQADVGERFAPVLDDPHLLAAEIDSLHDFQQWSAAVKRQIGEALGAGSGRGLHVDLSFERRLLTALLDIVPPGVDEIFSTFRIVEAVEADDGSARQAEQQIGRRRKPDRDDKKIEKYVVVDMAPTGHALELLRTPARLLHWCRLLLKTLAPHRTLPLVQNLAVEIATVEQRARGLAATIRDATRTAVWPVMLAEPLPDRETGRLLEALKELEAPAHAIFVNRVLAEADVEGCVRCRRARAWQQATLAGLKRRYRGWKLYCVREFAREIAGAPRLRTFTHSLWRLD